MSLPQERGSQRPGSAFDAGLPGAEVPSASGLYGIPEGDKLALAPPPCNTGVLSTSATIDYAAGTFPAGVPLRDVLPHFESLHASEWADTERGANGYRRGVARGHIRVFYDGNDNMGVFFELRGQGCDQFEAEQRFHGLEDWQEWQKRMLDLGVTFTRFDVAFDDQGQGAEAVLHMDRVRRAIEQGEVVSLWEYADPSGKVSLSTGDRLSDVVHFGSILSEFSAVFYDKAKEQIQKGRQLPVDWHWIRCEARFKKERAQAMVKRFVSEGVQAVAEVLYRYLDFKVVSADKNRTRWKTVGWWSSFLENAKKSTLVVEKVVRTIERTRTWLEDQVAASFAVVVMAADGGRGFVKTLFDKGKARVEDPDKSSVYRQMLAAVVKQADPDPLPCPEHNLLVATVMYYSGGDPKFYARCRECGFTGPLVENKREAKAAFRAVAPAAVSSKLDAWWEELQGSVSSAPVCEMCGDNIRWHSKSQVDGICFHCFRQFDEEIDKALLAL